MPETISQYFFGNSLVAYDAGGVQAMVPYWMDVLAETAGNTYAFSGGYGFLRQFADSPEPVSAWGIAGVDPAIAEDAVFSTAALDSVVITPANFIQDVAPGSDYVGDSRSPVDAVIDIVETINASQPTAQILIYEGWPDMAQFTDAMPPDAASVQAYYDYALGEYHDWYDTLIDEVNAAFPEAEVQLLPVNTILADLLTTTLSDIPAEDLYVDDAPHGTETLYYLASMITYQAAYGAPAPLPDTLPDTVHPSVFASYDEINTVISDALIEEGILGDDLSEGPGDPEPEPEPDGSDADDPDAPVISPTPEPQPPVGDNGDREQPGPPPEPEPPEPEPEPVGSDQDEPGEFPPAPPAPVGTFAANFFTVLPATQSLEEIDFTAPPDATGSQDDLDFFGNPGALWDDGPADHVAAHYSQTLESPDGGIYTMSLLADDQAQLYVDGALILDTRDAGFEEMQESTVTLQPGNHLIEVLYLEQTGEASLQLGLTRANDLPDPGTGLREAVEDADDVTAILALLDRSWSAMEAEAEMVNRLEEEDPAESSGALGA
ncbi:PA14 domain-containing protein [Primorskyibacter sp. 2E107]|uniref:PA14 domain-containing protein n=1 Tax=Primorskyibacter sp. 2E107 TaxID=3403458 RepID=UPI003AF68B93